jgi:hypothetical protein
MSNVTQYTQTDSGSQPVPAHVAELESYIASRGVDKDYTLGLAKATMAVCDYFIATMPPDIAIRTIYNLHGGVAAAKAAAKQQVRDEKAAKQRAKARRVAAKQQADEESSRRLNALFQAEPQPVEPGTGNINDMFQ